MKIISFVLLFLTLSSSILPNFAFSAGLVPCGPGTDKPSCELCDFFVMINNIVKFFLVPDKDINQNVPIVPALAVLMVLIGGFMYILAAAGGGGANMISQAKGLFKGVVIGLLVAYGAWIIVDTFLTVLGVSTWQGTGEWWTINCQ